MSDPGNPVFIVDAMLGDLARWLRMLGYDTLYSRKDPDWAILKKLEKEPERILVTRDVSLCRRALKKRAKCILIESNNIVERLVEVARRVPIRLYIDMDISRCPICNTPLIRVDAKHVRNKVAPGVLERQSEFWICPGCGKVYWRGGHWRGIEKTLEEARRKLKEVEE